MPNLCSSYILTDAHTTQPYALTYIHVYAHMYLFWLLIYYIAVEV